MHDKKESEEKKKIGSKKATQCGSVDWKVYRRNLIEKRAGETKELKSLQNKKHHTKSGFDRPNNATHLSFSIQLENFFHSKKMKGLLSRYVGEKNVFIRLQNRVDYDYALTTFPNQ